MWRAVPIAIGPTLQFKIKLSTIKKEVQVSSLNNLKVELQNITLTQFTQMKQNFGLVSIALFLLTSTLLKAQLSLQEIEDVHGGRINAVTDFLQSTDTSVIFVTTDSVDAALYEKVHIPSVSSSIPDYEIFISSEASVLYFDDAIADNGLKLHKNTNGDIVSNTEPVEVKNLMQVYPIPVYSFMTVEFQIPKTTIGKLSIFNLKGKEIEVIAVDVFKEGTYKETIAPRHLPRGVYFITLMLEDYMETRKLIVAR